MLYIDEKVKTPCAVAWRTFESRLEIDTEHPHAQELQKIANELFNLQWTVDETSADREKGNALLKRVAELSDFTAATQMDFGWKETSLKQREKALKKKALRWYTDLKAGHDSIEAWGFETGILLDECADMIDPLYSIIWRGKGHGEALIALFMYGYQCGQKAASEAVAAKPVKD